MNEGKYLTKVVAPLREVYMVFEFRQKDGEWQGFIEPAPEGQGLERVLFARTRLSEFRTDGDKLTCQFQMEVPFPGLVEVVGTVTEKTFIGQATIVEMGLKIPIAGEKM